MRPTKRIPFWHVEENFKKSYIALVGPYLKYALAMLSPYKRKDIEV